MMRSPSIGTGRLLRDSASLTSARVIGAASATFFGLVAARVWGPGDFGHFSVTLILFGYQLLLVDWGQQRILVTKVSADPDRATEFAAASLAVKLAASLLAVAAGLTISLMLPPVAARGLRVLVFSVPLYAIYSTCDGLMLGLQRARTVAALEAPHAALKAVLAVVIILAGEATPVTVFWAYVALDAVRALVALILLPFGPGEWFSKIRMRIAVEMSREGVSTFLWAILFGLYYRFDLTYLSTVRSAEEVGLYAAACRFLDLATLVLIALTTVLLPTLTRLGATDERQFKSFVDGFTRRSIIATLGVSVVLSAGAASLVQVLYGHQYTNAAVSLQRLALGFPASGVSYVFGTALLARGHHRTMPVVYGVMLGVKALASASIVPHGGYLATSTIQPICEWLCAAAVLYPFARLVGSVAIGRLPFAGVAAAVSFLSGVGVSHWWPHAGMVVAPLVYLGGLLVFRVVGLSELAELWRIAKSRRPKIHDGLAPSTPGSSQ